jgi:DNA-binding NtrC family response regulator
MKVKILVVDDAAPVRHMLKELLAGAGYDVLAAGSFEEGRQLADSANPDLMLIDVRLGEYNGLQLAVRERVNHPERPIIVMTGHSDLASARRAAMCTVFKVVNPQSKFLVSVGRFWRFLLTFVCTTSTISLRSHQEHTDT